MHQDDALSKEAARLAAREQELAIKEAQLRSWEQQLNEQKRSLDWWKAPKFARESMEVVLSSV